MYFFLPYKDNKNKISNNLPTTSHPVIKINHFKTFTIILQQSTL